MREEETERLDFLIGRPFLGQASDIAFLLGALEKFPYFQPLRMLYLKILYTQNAQDFPEQLKTAAIYSADRSLLFDYIVREDIQELSGAASSKETQEKPARGKENFSEHRYAFDQWLTLGEKVVPHPDEPAQISNDKFRIIDRFLYNYKGPGFHSKESLWPSSGFSEPSEISEEDLMTETLARLYVDQKKYAKALKAYKILSLKYPEKSGSFADKIRFIKDKIHKT